MIHLTLILVYDRGLRFIFFYVDNKLFQTICWKSNPFHIELPWNLYWKSIDLTYVGLFLDSLLCFIDLCV